MAINTFLPNPSCGFFNVFTSFEQSREAFCRDLKTRNDGTMTAEKVKNFITGYLDIGAACQVAISALFGIGILITMLRVDSFVCSAAAFGFLTHEVYQVRSHLQQLQNKISEQCPNPSDQFVFNKQFYKDWCEFKEGVSSNTFLFSYFAREQLDEMTEGFKLISEIEDNILMRSVRYIAGFLDTPVGKIIQKIFKNA